MNYIAHRINTVSELIALDKSYGLEVDLRDNINDEIYINHDPFIQGENFEIFLKEYKHGTIILNIKSERIELKVLELLKKNKINNYFFLDSSFPMIKQLVDMGEKKIAIRFSEYEGLDTLKNMKGKIKWVWVDCFSKLPLNNSIYKQIKKMDYKLCFVSPELQGQPEKIEEYFGQIYKEKIYFDAICTKVYNINNWKALFEKYKY